MVFNFKKKIVVGVAVSPEIGVEVAQIDYEAKTVLKYASRQLAYDNNTCSISDMDIFKETLQELLDELAIPKGSEIVLTLPPIAFEVAGYPASLNEQEISGAVEESLLEMPIFQNNEPCIDIVRLPNSTIQQHKIVSTAIQKVMAVEIAMQIKDLGYKLLTIDTSVNADLNALIYSERINVEDDTSWVLLLVEQNCCRIIPMQGKNYVDCYEEKVGIGEVLGDAENYSTVVGAVSPILKHVPAQFLYVVSNTSIISAKILADKLEYGAQIIHQEANCYTAEPFLEVSEEIDESFSKMISLGVIGAAIRRDFEKESNANFNLYNSSLGDIYVLEQPLEVFFAGKNWVLSVENMIIASIILAIPVVIISLAIFLFLTHSCNTEKNKIDEIDRDIQTLQQKLKANEQVSADLFDEGDEIRLGISHNKGVYQYYKIVGTEIPKKVWLTELKLGAHTTIKGQADNLESIYSFFRNVKDYNPSSAIKLHKLALASKSKLTELDAEGGFDTESILTSMNADFYEFVITDDPEEIAIIENASKPKEEAEEGNVLGLPEV